MKAEISEASRVAASVWRHRQQIERQAAARFARLARELGELGAEEAVIKLARKASEDELRHASLCRDLITHFGGESYEGPAPDAPPVGPAQAPHRARVLYELVAMSCVTETLSTALLGKLVEKANDPVARKTMHSILRDEIKHSQLGWAHLAAEHANGQTIDLGRHLPSMLQTTVQEELFSTTEEPSLQDELSGMGSLSRGDRLSTFVEVMTAVVFPGLAQFGVDVSPGRQWLEQRLSRASSQQPG